MTEPAAGSAVTELRTSAQRDGDDYIVNGTKIFSTHSPDASVFLVYVRFGPGVSGIGSIIVERNTPGFDIGKASAFLGGDSWCPLFFDNCRIPARNVLLGPGGFKMQMSAFNAERTGNAARSLALGRLAFNIAREHVLTRKQFGKFLCEFQGIQWKFSDMAVKLDCAQLALYRAASRADKGMPSAHETAIAKICANQTGFEVADAAMQVMGGMGYSEESLIEYCFRRTRGWMIAGGSVEILKNRIAEGVFQRRFTQRDRNAEAAE
ncbi:MAG: acyl-CoA dehydrogenase family protein [Variibacter sp.]